MDDAKRHARRDKRNAKRRLKRQVDNVVKAAARALNDPNVIGREHELAKEAYNTGIKYLEGSKPDAEGQKE